LATSPCLKKQLNYLLFSYLADWHLIAQKISCQTFARLSRFFPSKNNDNVFTVNVNRQVVIWAQISR